jgi:hypothetical protein
VKADDLALIRELHRDKMTIYLRHIAVARLVGDYEFNNAYQYVINREDTHLKWLESAITEFGGTPETVATPTVTPASGKKNDRFLPLVAEDAAQAGELVARWKPRAAEIRSDRHRKLVNVILGETVEQKRFFDHVGAGQDDLLGRRMAGASTGDGVMPVRWVE